MRLETFSKANRKRCEAANGFNHRLNDWSLSDWITALVGEVGEAANIVKKLNRIRDDIHGNASDDSEETLRAKLADELADAFIYLNLIFQAMGNDPTQTVLSKFNRTSKKIGYPSRLRRDA